jgi:hypothetical protein
MPPQAIAMPGVGLLSQATSSAKTTMIGGGESRSLTNRATRRRRGANNAAHVTGLLTGLGDGGLLIHRRSWLLTAAGAALPLLAVGALAATAAAPSLPTCARAGVSSLRTSDLDHTRRTGACGERHSPPSCGSPPEDR